MYGVDKALYNLITDSEHVQAIMKVSSKSAANVMPYNPSTKMKAPMVTFYESDSDNYLHIPGCQQMTYRLDIWTSSLEQSTRLAEVIDDILSVKDISNEYARVLKFTLFTSGDTFDDQTKVYHKSLVYKIVAIDKQV